MVSDLNTFAHKGCKIAAQKKVWFSTNFALLAGFFWYQCYYPHLSRDALSPVCRIFIMFFSSKYQLLALKKVTHQLDQLVVEACLGQGR